MRRRFSRAINQLHLWLGLGSGLVLFVVCLTGTLLVYTDEVIQLLEPEKFEVKQVGSEALPAEMLVEILEDSTGGAVTAVMLPHDLEETAVLTVKMNPEERRGTRYYLDPYTGEILGLHGGPVKEFFTSTFRLHRWLMLETSIGRPIVGVATIVFTFMLISGLIMWWPVRWRLLRSATRIKWKAPAAKRNYDLHKVLGFYACIFLLMMTLTGLNWSFSWFRDGAGNLLGAEVFGRSPKPEWNAPADTTQARLSFAELRDLADMYLPFEGNHQFSTDKGVIAEVRKYQTGFTALSIPDKLWFNAYTGELLGSDIFGNKPFNEKVAASLHDLHMGKLYGGMNKLIFFIAALIGTSLPVTGTFIWWKKRAATRKVRRA